MIVKKDPRCQLFILHGEQLVWNPTCEKTHIFFKDDNDRTPDLDSQQKLTLN